jgi:hypothetical protein
MLRRLGQPSADDQASTSDETGFPSLDKPFGLEDHPPGIRFYKGRTSFFHPYALLQSMRYQTDLITLSFVDADVTVAGRGLHGLYVHLAEHQVAWIVEQGERYESASDAAAHIRQIVEVVKEQEQ